MQKKDIPVLLLTGYLGSGKTTLVNHILANEKGIKFAVIVNDIGEVNIDADLIQKGGVVGKKDDSLVALQNGCICCTLKMDLIEQIFDLMKMQRFDYIVIEASGICEPEPIAQTICSIPQMGGAYVKYGVCRLDSIVTVVDALRLQSEFACGDELTRKHIDEEDIENLIIQQIEFCNIILLNKASEVKPEELARIKQILHTLQPAAEIIECDYADVDIDKLINTHLFNFERVATSAGWIREIERQATEEEEHEAKADHHHHHDHDHECGHHHDHDHECECGHHHEHDHECECGHHHDHEHHHHDGESTLYYDEEDMHDADEVFNSIGIETAHPFTKEELDDKLKTLGTDDSLGHILRSKGIVKGTDGKWFEFDFVSGDYEIRECTPDVGGRMCVIGEKLDAHKIYDLMKG